MKTRHVYNSIIAKALKANAITLYPFIFYKLKEPNKTTVTHELIHIMQVRKHGFFSFYISYLLFYFAYRLMGHNKERAYLLIPYEMAAFSGEKGA